MLATIALFVWGITVYVIVRYRVHINISISAKSSRGRVANPLAPRQAERTPTLAANLRSVSAKTGLGSGGVASFDAPLPFEADLCSALVNMQCPKPKARAIAARVVRQGGTFDEMLRAAIQEAA
jgi:hypothetical protein